MNRRDPLLCGHCDRDEYTNTDFRVMCPCGRSAHRSCRDRCKSEPDRSGRERGG